jgi:hypothetical protein
MSEICTPENINPLNPNGFKFSIQKLPDLTFFIQDVQIPNLTIGQISQATSVQDVPIPGETASFSDLTVSFLVDEDFKNWTKIYEWMIGLTYPENHQIYTDFLDKSKNAQSRTELAKGYSDGTLTILGSNNKAVRSISFIDMFPISLDGASFSAQNTDVNYLRANCTFAYSYYKIIG